MRTFVASANSANSRWHVIDANGQVLGRVATLAAKLLQGKHKAIYTPFIDTGRSRRHRQRRVGQADRPEGRPETLSPAQRIRRRPARGARGGRPQAPANPARRGGRARHAAQDEDGRCDVPQAQGLRRRRASACRPATHQNRGRVNLASIEYYATGRRKTSTARVFLRPGKGDITVNHREFSNYFPTDQLRTQVRRPLHADGDGRQVRHPRHRRRRRNHRPGWCGTARASPARWSSSTPSCASS